MTAKRKEDALMSEYAEGIVNYVAKFAARLLGVANLGADETIPPEKANIIVTHLATWLVEPLFVTEPVTVRELSELFDQYFKTGSV